MGNAVPVMTRTLVQAWHYARRRGVRHSAAKAFRTYVLGRERWYVTSGDLTSWKGVARRDPETEIRLATDGDLPVLERLERQSPETLRAWLRPGHFFFVAARDGVPIAYRCLSTNPHRWVRDYFTLRPDQIYSLDLFTHAAWRSRGVSHDLMAGSNPILVAQGFREVVSIQRLDNAESIAMTRARGITQLGTLTRTCVLGRVSLRLDPV